MISDQWAQIWLLLQGKEQHFKYRRQDKTTDLANRDTRTNTIDRRGKQIRKSVSWRSSGSSCGLTFQNTTSVRGFLIRQMSFHSQFGRQFKVTLNITVSPWRNAWNPQTVAYLQAGIRIQNFAITKNEYKVRREVTLNTLLEFKYQWAERCSWKLVSLTMCPSELWHRVLLWRNSVCPRGGG